MFSTFNPIVFLRALQALFALITLSVFASVMSYLNGLPPPLPSSPASIAYPIFTSTLTLLLSLPYLTIAPRYFPGIANKYAMFTVETITMILWLAGWIAPAAFLGGLDVCKGGVCYSARAGTVFASFEWLLFVGTTVLAARYCWNGGNGTTAVNRTASVKGLNISRPMPMSTSNGTGTPFPGAGALGSNPTMGGGRWPEKNAGMV